MYLNRNVLDITITIDAESVRYARTPLQYGKLFRTRGIEGAGPPRYRTGGPELDRLLLWIPLITRAAFDQYDRYGKCSICSIDPIHSFIEKK